MNEALERYAKDCQEELKQLIRELAPIPAPSHEEDLRAEYVLDYLRAHGAEGVYIDSAKNVIWPYGVTEDNDLYLFQAHMDVVFPDKTPLPFREDETKFYCPGVSDDTTMLAELLTVARFFISNHYRPKKGVLFVANACEEGLGNLDGTRQLFRDFGSRIKEFISIDAGPTSIVTRAVGSYRYGITVRTPGGHSWGAFGNKNAIIELSELLRDLYQIPLPEKEGARTTFNVGTISGGTSVNTIAQNAACLYEYRSNDRDCLKYMTEAFEKVVASHRQDNVRIEVELLGERPCNGDVDEAAEQAIVDRISACIERAWGKEARLHTSSTDSNIPLSLGVPAVTIGGCVCAGAHTREEWMDHTSLLTGMRYLLDVFSYYFEAPDQT